MSDKLRWSVVGDEFEDELAMQLGVPSEVSLVALLPIGFPHGRFGSVTRKPARELTHFDRWGRRSPPTHSKRRQHQVRAELHE